MITEDILYLSVRELGELLRTKQVSPVELAKEYLERSEELGGELNAYAALTRDLAMAQARRAEQEIGSGMHRGPLHGIPYAAKDLLAVRWYPTTWGAAPLAKQKFAADASVIQKLTDGGAVLIGKAAMIELAGGLGYKFANASATGAAKNPWSQERWTCGSSSGSGAIVSAGLAAFAIGSETWGSILCPSAHCGITGLRPTYGRVSRHGAMPLSFTLDKIGPLARSAEDCALILSVIAAHDDEDPSSLAQLDAQFVWPPASGPATRPLKSLRIGWVTDQCKGSPAEVHKLCNAAVDKLRHAGASVENVTMPEGPFVAATEIILAAEAGSALRPLVTAGTVAQLTDPSARLGGYLYETLPAADFETAQRIRLVAQKKMDVLFQRFDVLAGPSTGEPAFRLDVDLDKAADYPDPLGCLGNLCGLPAISVPCGFTTERLPVGLQFVGHALDEQAVLSAAIGYQSITDWHKRRPKLQ
jgi:aspartyl-tRNA(Asn)/glutamyl-tRNA(Gln) amidotransferase subunit A